METRRENMLVITNDHHKYCNPINITGITGECLDILWYAVVILDRAPRQHLAGFRGIHTDSCHLSLKQRKLEVISTT